VSPLCYELHAMCSLCAAWPQNIDGVTLGGHGAAAPKPSEPQVPPQ